MIESIRTWLSSQLFDLDEHRTDYCCGWNHAVMHLIAELPVLSARVPEITATPAGGMRADAFPDDSSVVDDPDATTPRQRFDVSDAGDGC